MTAPLDVAVADVLRARRIKLGVRQQDVADAAFMKRGQVAHIEQGREGLTLTTLDLMARALGTTAWAVLRQAATDKAKPGDGGGAR